MIRNILVEGIDCSGKSTLVKELKNRLKWDSKALTHKNTNQFLRYLHEYSSLENTIIERGHVSESIYGELWQRPKAFSPGELSILDDIVTETMLVIFATPAIKMVERRYRERKHVLQKIRLDELRTGNALFAKWFQARPCYKLISYRSRDFDELENLTDKVVYRLEKESGHDLDRS